MSTYVESFLLRHGMNNNDRVLSLQNTAPEHSVCAVVLELLRRTLNVGVDGGQTLQALAEPGGQAFERADTLRGRSEASVHAACKERTYAREDRITTSDRRRLEHAQECRARRLLFRRLIRMELDRALAGPRLAHTKIVPVVVDDHAAIMVSAFCYFARTESTNCSGGPFLGCGAQPWMCSGPK